MIRSEVQPPVAAAPVAASEGGGMRWWNSPLLFIGGGVALMLGVIPVAAVVIMAHSLAKSCDECFGKSQNGSHHAFGPDMEPRVAVIMPGESDPTHIAKPVGRRGEEV